MVQIGEILLVERLIQTVFLVEALHHGFRNALFAFGKRAAGDGVHQKETGGDEDDDGDDTG